MDKVFEVIAESGKTKFSSACLGGRNGIHDAFALEGNISSSGLDGWGDFHFRGNFLSTIHRHFADVRARFLCAMS